MKAYYMLCEGLQHPPHIAITFSQHTTPGFTLMGSVWPNSTWLKFKCDILVYW